MGSTGWAPYAHGEYWLLDTERGLLMVAAEAQELGPLFDEAKRTVAKVLETIELIDLG